MSDDQQGRLPAPVLRTRPATMLTAIGLCVFVMIMQLMPEVRDGGSLSRFAGSITAAVAR